MSALDEAIRGLWMALRADGEPGTLLVDIHRDGRVVFQREMPNGITTWTVRADLVEGGADPLPSVALAKRVGSPKAGTP